MTAQLKTFPDRDAMTAALSALISDRLQQALDQRGAAGLVVSGGSTPKPLFVSLSQIDLDWSRVTISLADERWVATDSSDSNEYLLRASLLLGKASAATFIPLKTADATPQAGVDACHRALARLPSPADIVLLGMGDDGHTASLFPHAEQLSAALDLTNPASVAALTPNELPAHAPYPRMTMTLPRLLDSRLLLLMLAGQSKLSVYNAALGGHDVHEMPVRAVLKQSRVPVMTYWAP